AGILSKSTCRGCRQQSLGPGEASAAWAVARHRSDFPVARVYDRAMSPPVHVALLPAFVTPAALQGGVAVVIDILRASTTIVHALAEGARAVLPFESVDDARAAAAIQSPGSALLGGERGGERIEGFDLGNSPLEYTPDVVSGKT